MVLGCACVAAENNILPVAASRQAICPILLYETNKCPLVSITICRGLDQTLMILSLFQVLLSITARVIPPMMAIKDFLFLSSTAIPLGIAVTGTSLITLPNGY